MQTTRNKQQEQGRAKRLQRPKPSRPKPKIECFAQWPRPEEPRFKPLWQRTTVYKPNGQTVQRPSWPSFSKKTSRHCQTAHRLNEQQPKHEEKPSNLKPSKQTNAVSESNRRKGKSGQRYKKQPSWPKRQRAKQPRRPKPKKTSRTASETVSSRT